MCLDLRIAIFDSPMGNYQYWALFIDKGPDSIIFEVNGEHPNFQRHVSVGQPEDDPVRHFRESFFVGRVCLEDVWWFRRLISRLPVDNETVGWDCQFYVFDIIDKLVDEGIMDAGDYLDVRSELIARRKLLLG